VSTPRKLVVPAVDGEVNNDEVINDVVLFSSRPNVIFAPLSNDFTVFRTTPFAEFTGRQLAGQI